MEPDYESSFWADHDENCHGTIDTEDMREEYPEGFTWTCCDKLGTEEGCTLSRHQPMEGLSKRAKFESGEDDDDDDDDEGDEGDEGDEDDE
jgi:hypothetical protein